MLSFIVTYYILIRKSASTIAVTKEIKNKFGQTDTQLKLLKADLEASTKRYEKEQLMSRKQISKLTNTVQDHYKKQV